MMVLGRLSRDLRRRSFSSAAKGLQGVKAGESAICTVGLGSGLNYRGYAIEDLAEKCCFEEVAHLLLKEKLPNRAELQEYTALIAAGRQLPPPVCAVLEQFPRTATRWTCCALASPCWHAWSL